MTNPCTELGRVTRAYVSAFTRTRVHRVSVMAQEKRCLVANFNGALESGRWIATAVWSVNIPTFVNLLNCDVTTDGRETACLMSAQWRGRALVRCTVTLDNGDAQTQYFDAIIDGSYFHNDVIPAAGPYQISAIGYNPGPGNSVVLSGALGNGAFKDVVSYQYTIAGGIPPRVVSLASGHLPDGLSLYGSGIVAGTRTTPGTYTFNLLATDSNGNSFTLPDTSTTLSTDIVNWSLVLSGSGQTPNSSIIAEPVMAIMNNSSKLSVSPDNGVSWSVQTLTGLVAPFFSVMYQGDMYVFEATGYAGAIKTIGMSLPLSFNTFANPPGAANTDGITGTFVINGSLYVGLNSRTKYTLAKMVSAGVSWQEKDTGITAPAATGIACMVFTGTAYLFGTTGGEILRSTDLLTFTKQATGFSNPVTTIAYLNGVIIASENGATWYRSTNDGITWVLGTGVSIGYIVATPSMFVAAYTNTVISSTDGINWVTRYSNSAGGIVAALPAVTSTHVLFPIQSSYAFLGSS
jgi:hypothetical protein